MPRSSRDGAGDTHLAEDLVQTALARLYVPWPGTFQIAGGQWVVIQRRCRWAGTAPSRPSSPAACKYLSSRSRATAERARPVLQAGGCRSVHLTAAAAGPDR